MTNHATPTPTDLPDTDKHASPELLRKLQTTTEGGAILTADYAGAYSLLDGIYACIVEHLRLHALSAAAPAAPADLITIRKPTTRAEVEWLAKLAHLLVSDVNDTLQRVLDGAPQAQQPTAPQAGAKSYPPLPRPHTAAYDGPEESWPDLYAETDLKEFADATAALRARGAVPSAPWAALSLDEVRDLTAMQAGAPWDDHYLQPLAEVLVIYESLRATGARPVDPARSGASAGLPSFADWLKRAYRQPQDFYTVHNMEVAYVAGQHSAATPAAVSAPSVPSVPEGWRLVPVEPTPEMVHAVRFAGDPRAPAIGARIILGETVYPFVGEEVAERMCRAMLAAAPQADHG